MRFALLGAFTIDWPIRFEEYIYGARPVQQLRPPSVKLRLLANGLVSEPVLDTLTTYLCLISLSFIISSLQVQSDGLSYYSVDRTLLWDVLARFGASRRMVAVIRQFDDGMQACVRLDNGECSNVFDVLQGVRQGCVLARHCYSTPFSRRYGAWPRNDFSLMQPARTTWCCPNERRKGRRKAQHAQTKLTDRGAEGGGVAEVVEYAVRLRCGHRMAIIGRVGKDDEGDRDYMRGVRFTVSEAKMNIMCLQT